MNKILNFRKFDQPLLVLYLLLLAIGWLAIYSATYGVLTQQQEVLDRFYIKQIYWMVFSCLAVFAILKTPMHYLEMLPKTIFIFSLAMLVLVFFFPAVKGAHRWIKLPGIQFQPSELMKIGFVLFGSQIIVEAKTNWEIVWKFGGTLLLTTGLIVAEPNLSGTLAYFFIFFVMLCFSRIPFYYLVSVLAPIFSVVFVTNFWLFLIYFAIVAYYLAVFSDYSVVKKSISILMILFIYFNIPVAWNLLKDYQKNRILVFVDPSLDPLGAGYQIIQSKIAVGSGELFGKGYLQGTQKNLKFLPESHNDFIFSTICEEVGFLGAFFLLLIYFLFFWRIIYLTSNQKDKNRFLVSVGFLAFLFYQFMINTGMTLGLLPSTGVSLPFLSYGGSNLVIASMAVAYLMKKSEYSS